MTPITNKETENIIKNMSYLGFIHLGGLQFRVNLRQSVMGNDYIDIDLSTTAQNWCATIIAENIIHSVRF